MLHSASAFMADSLISGHTTEIKTAIAAFLVGTIVGITGMGGGALMTPALIFLGVGDASTVVTADLTAAAVYKSAGATVHWREGSPNIHLAGWLILGSVPFAFIGPYFIRWVAPGDDIETTLKRFIGIALLLAATTFAARLYIQLRRVVSTTSAKTGEPKIRPIPTIAIGAFGGFLVGITSVGSGSVIMIALLMLYPTLSAVKLVGTDLVQAVPLVISAAISNIIANGLDWSILIPLVIGSVPGSILGSKIAPRVPSSAIRRGIIVVLTVSGLALLDKAGWWPLGYHNGAESHPLTIVTIGLVLLAVLPFVWGGLRRGVGLPMFGQPALADIEAPAGSPAARRARRAAKKAAAARAGTPTEGGQGNGQGNGPGRGPGGMGPGAEKAAAGRPAKKAAAAAKRAGPRPGAPVNGASVNGATVNAAASNGAAAHRHTDEALTSDVPESEETAPRPVGT